MRGTAAKRMLLREDIATQVATEHALGVPVNTLLKRLALECSRPTLVKLIDAQSLANDNSAVHSSLHPAWLDPDGPKLQVQPDNWNYIGRFPLGYWVCKDTLI